MKKFEYTPPEQPRELILKLGQKITDRIGHTVTAEATASYNQWTTFVFKIHM